jgi:alkanesulfonate monooxygenase
MAYDDRYERAMEFVQVVRGLWDSWESDAFLEDKASGIFYDPAKLHVLDHKGKYFSVRGPLSVARTPQGRPVIVQAGASEQGREIAAATADIVFSAEQDLAAAQSYYASIKGRLAKYGRSRDEVLILPGLVAIVGATREEARAKHEQLQALIDPLVGLSQLYGNFGNLSDCPLDGPVPEPKDPQLRSRAQVMVDKARRENLTIRELYKAVAAGRGHRTVIGTPADVADTMEEWQTAGAADGFNIIPSHLPVALDDFVALVVPELQRRGLFRTAYEADTFRGNLGLPVPETAY